MDEPCSALDPIATLKIEELIEQLKQQYTIAIVTHNLQQAARVSQYTGFFLTGNMIEFAPTRADLLAPTEAADGRFHHRPLWLSRALAVDSQSVWQRRPPRKGQAQRYHAKR